MAKKRSLTGSLELKVYNLIQNLLVEETEQRKKDAPDDDSFSIALARDLRPSQVVDYVQAKDFLLRRTKRNMLLKVVETALQAARDQEIEEIEDNGDNMSPSIGDVIDSDFEGVDEKDLMEVKDTNALNKSVISL